MSYEVSLAWTSDPRFKQFKGHWYERRELERAQLRVLAEQTLAAIDRDETPVRPGGEAGGDKHQLRAIPVMTRGVPGIIPGTEPENTRRLDRSLLRGYSVR